MFAHERAVSRTETRGASWKLAIYCPYLYPWMIDLAQEIHKHVKDVILHTVRIRSNHPSAVFKVDQNYDKRHEANISISEVSGLETWAGAGILPHPKLFIKVLRDKPDLLVVFGAESIGSLLLAPIVKARGIATILIGERNFDNRPQLHLFMRSLSTIKRALAKIAHRNADLILAESNASKDYLIKLGCSSDKIYVYPHGVDHTQFRPQAPNYDFARKMRISDEDLGKIKVLYPNGFRTNKGIGYLAEACQSNLLKDVIFLINKYGPEISSYEPLLQNCGNVRMLPLVQPEDMVDLYSISDIVIVSSITTVSADVSPNVVLEAMACGKAIIATNIGGIPDILSNCGILIPERDSEAIIEAILKLASDAQLRACYGRLARQRAEHVLSIERYADKILQLCTLITESGRGGIREV